MEGYCIEIATDRPYPLQGYCNAFFAGVRDGIYIYDRYPMASLHPPMIAAYHSGKRAGMLYAKRCNPAARAVNGTGYDHHLMQAWKRFIKPYEKEGRAH